MLQIDEATTITLTTPPSSNCNENLMGILSFCGLKKQKKDPKTKKKTSTQLETLYTIHHTDL